MNVLEEIKSVIEIKIDIKEEALADKLYDLAVAPLLQKVVDLIPTEIDNMFLAANEEKIKNEFYKLIAKGAELAEDAVDGALGNDEKA